MRLGLLVCDHVREEHLGISGDYDEMFERIFAGHPEVDVVAYDVINGELPADPGECDGWITTGSRYSVNDDQQWIRDLEGFVRDIAEAGTPFVGICFGHQLLAKALGGSVVKSERGWGVGVHEVEVRQELGLGSSYRVINNHQDQVEVLPAGAEVLGWTDHCPVSVMSVGGNMLGLQGHPEFEASFSAALIDARREMLSAETAAAGLASLGAGTDSERLADWIIGFLQPEDG